MFELPVSLILYAEQNQPLNNLTGIPSHTLKGSALAPHSYTPTGKIDESYGVISGSRQSWSGNYLPEPDPRRSLMVARNNSKRLSLLTNNSSITNSRTQERLWAGSPPSYDIRSSTSHDNYYGYPLPSKPDRHSDLTIGYDESISDSPRSICTNLSTVSADTTATGQSSPVDSSDSSPSTPIRVAIPIHFPIDNTPDDIVNAITASPEPAHSLSDGHSPPKNNSPARSNLSVESGGSFRARTISRSDYHLSMDNEYAPPSAYMYADDGVLEDRLEAGLFRPPRPGLSSNRSEFRQSRNDSEGNSPMAYQRDHTAPQGPPVPPPPGLEIYHNVPGAPTRTGPPRRRHSDGEHTVKIAPAPTSQEYNRSSSAPPPSRCVRWNKDLVAPSPVFASQRRKGWYNRRG